MSEERDDRVAGHLRPRTGGEERLARLAASLGLDLPPFEGPLSAFRVGASHESGDPIYLGGDLHAVHPEARDRRTGRSLDHSLDSARIILDDLEHPSTEVTAVEGVWCVAIDPDLVHSAPYFSLWDSEGRLRTWLLLPPPNMMIDLGHFWLPSVPDVSASPRPTPPDPAAP